MAVTALEGKSEAISTRAPRMAIAAIVSYQIRLIALIFLRPGLAPSGHTISEWAIGPFAVYSAIFGFPLGSGAYGPGVNLGWPPRDSHFLRVWLWVVMQGWQATRRSRHGLYLEIQAKG